MIQKIRVLEPVALYPGSARSFVEGYRQSFDSQGNLNPSLVAELRYAAQPAHRALDALKRRGILYNEQRTFVDTILLQGFWTPVGLVERAKVVQLGN